MNIMHRHTHSSTFRSLPLGRAGGGSAFYILGTALSLAFTMVMAVVYYIKLAPIYPEANRSRTVYFDGLRVIADGRGWGQTGFSAEAFEEWFAGSKNVEYCAPTMLAAGTNKVSERAHEFIVRGKDDFVEAVVNRTNTDFFKIYRYDFLAGRPFTPGELEANEHVCVISDRFAEQLFGKDADALGLTVQEENGQALRVVGVFRSASQLTPDSYADVIVPYSLRSVNAGGRYFGLYSIVATVKDTEQLRALKQELDEVAARYSTEEVIGRMFNFGEGVKHRLDITGQLETHPMHVLRAETHADQGLDATISNWQVIKHYAGLLFVLLFVPTLNLCAIVAGRMERRAPEMAVRKTFGARRSTLLWQVVRENLVMTTIGGIIGLVLAWLAIYALRTEILSMFFDYKTLGSAPIVSGEMLFSPLLFLGAFLAILILNLLAAVLPAWWSLRKPIVGELMKKQ